MIAETLITAAVLLTNANVLTSPHPTPASFEVSATGEVTGVTTDGTTFEQTNVAGTEIKLQHFSIAEAWWYVSDKGVIGVGGGLTPLQALSIYLTM